VLSKKYKIFCSIDKQKYFVYNNSMKLLIATVISLSISTGAVAQNWKSWDNPIAPFDATVPRTFTGPISIEWRLADDINKACDSASRRFGNAGFGGQDVQGCAFWWGPTCVIITKKKPTMHTVGHEMRHCFYGNWH
jgi:hypothetical protein